jgi:hypothetical protein
LSVQLSYQLVARRLYLPVGLHFQLLLPLFFLLSFVHHLVKLVVLWPLDPLPWIQTQQRARFGAASE